jgi:hypothetical protein
MVSAARDIIFLQTQKAKLENPYFIFRCHWSVLKEVLGPNNATRMAAAVLKQGSQ